jgi:hypothetical protein
MIFGLCLPVVGLLLAQTTFPMKTLVLTGHAAAGAVLQINGHYYADLEILAWITHASLSFRENQVTLTMLGAGQVSTDEQDGQRLSTSFISASIQYLEDARLRKEAVTKVVKIQRASRPVA